MRLHTGFVQNFCFIDSGIWSVTGRLYLTDSLLADNLPFCASAAWKCVSQNSCEGSSIQGGKLPQKPQTSCCGRCATGCSAFSSKERSRFKQCSGSACVFLWEKVIKEAVSLFNVAVILLQKRRAVVKPVVDGVIHSRCSSPKPQTAVGK